MAAGAMVGPGCVGFGVIKTVGAGMAGVGNGTGLATVTGLGVSVAAGAETGVAAESVVRVGTGLSIGVTVGDGVAVVVGVGSGTNVAVGPGPPQATSSNTAKAKIRSQRATIPTWPIIYGPGGHIQSIHSPLVDSWSRSYWIFHSPTAGSHMPVSISVNLCRIVMMETGDVRVDGELPVRCLRYKNAQP